MAGLSYNRQTKIIKVPAYQRTVVEKAVPIRILNLRSLPADCYTDSGVCGSFQTDGWCPRFHCLGCKFKGVRLID